MTEQKAPADMTLSSFFETMRNEGARDLRAAAWDAFARKGLPNRRVEAWRYTDLRAALRNVAPLACSTAAPALEPAFGERLGARLVVIDGVFRLDLSDLTDLPDGVAVQSLREALAQGEASTLAALAPQTNDAIVALNAALMQDGVVLRIAPGVVVAPPIELAMLTSGEHAQSSFTRSLVTLGEGAKATIVESARPLAQSSAQENHVLVFAIGAGAAIEHVAHFAPQAEDAVCVFSLLATLGRNSALNSFCLIEGGGVLRRQIFAQLAGEHATVAFNGATLLRARQHADTTLVIDHARPNGKSRERFRTILDESATGVFQGKVTVRAGAQKTDGAMQSKALLLSDGASMNNKPELEIFADDVVCGHGAACGRLDADQLFYLMARGLPRPEAEALLVEGFVNESMDGIADEAARERLRERVGVWLASREDKRK